MGRPKPVPTRKELWERMDGCDCPALGAQAKGRAVFKADRCTPTAIRCNGRMATVKANFQKYGYTWGPAR